MEWPRIWEEGLRGCFLTSPYSIPSMSDANGWLHFHKPRQHLSSCGLS